MNMNILLVDDEAVDLEWLRRRVVTHDHPLLQVVATANNGFAALKTMEQERIDIILSDIRMPIMTGMEFVRKAKELNPHVHIVFISGHQDFAYAKEAIELNASGYLLKPVDDGELNNMLTLLCSKIEYERNQDLSITETLSLVSQELLLRWFNDITPGQVEQHIYHFLTPIIQRGSAIAIIEIDDLEWTIKKMSVEDGHSLTVNINQFIRNFAQEFNLGTVLTGYDHRLVVLAAIEEAQFTSILEQLVHTFSKAFPLSTTIGIGMHTTEMDKLHDSYRQAQAALSMKWILGKNRLIRDARVSPTNQPIVPKLEVTVERMLQAILEYDLVTIDDCLVQLFYGDYPLFQKNDVYDLIIRITSKLHADLQQMNENLYELINWDSHQPTILFQSETVYDILAWLRRRFFELSELLYTKKQGQKRKLIEAITSYVEARLEQRITLNEVAGHFDFTPNYLGHLFKTETNVLFSDFLHELRMKHVCELLRDPTMKVYEIADKVGYKNIIYFNRQFKQSMGMSPGEYRKKHKI